MRSICFPVVIVFLAVVHSAWAQDTGLEKQSPSHKRVTKLHTSGLLAHHLQRANSLFSDQQYGEAAAEIREVESMLRRTQNVSPDDFDRARLQDVADELSKLAERTASGAKYIDVRMLRSTFSRACYALANSSVEHTMTSFAAGDGDLAAHHLENAVLHLELGIAYGVGMATDALREQIAQSRKLSSALISGGHPERFKEDVAKLSAEIDKLDKAQEAKLKAERDKEQSTKESRSGAKVGS